MSGLVELCTDTGRHVLTVSVDDVDVQIEHHSDGPMHYWSQRGQLIGSWLDVAAVNADRAELVVPKVKQVIVHVLMADGVVHTTSSTPDRITNDGVQIHQDQQVLNDDLGPMTDMSQTTTITWTEQWTEMTR